MALFLDSALVEDAQLVNQWGWVKGVTTNPSLMAKSPLSAALTLEKISSLNYTEIFYQLTSTDFDRALAEVEMALQILKNKTVVKIPATAMGFRVAAALNGRVATAITGIYSPTQAIVAREVEAKYAIAYVNRATRLLGDGLSLVRSMAHMVGGSKTEILAASIKSTEEAIATVEAGAQHLTLPLPVLQSLAINELSEQTFIEFNTNGRGLE